MAANKKKNNNYYGNLKKEFSEFLKAKDIANETERTYKSSKSNAVTRADDAGTKRVGKDLKINLKKERDAIGQLAGALFQGRRYEGGVKSTTKTVNKVYRPMGN